MRLVPSPTTLINTDGWVPPDRQLMGRPSRGAGGDTVARLLVTVPAERLVLRCGSMARDGRPHRRPAANDHGMPRSGTSLVSRGSEMTTGSHGIAGWANWATAWTSVGLMLLFSCGRTQADATTDTGGSVGPGASTGGSQSGGWTHGVDTGGVSRETGSAGGALAAGGSKTSSGASAGKSSSGGAAGSGVAASGGSGGGAGRATGGAPGPTGGATGGTTGTVGGSTATVPMCVPGQSVACACTSGLSGAQTCRSDGTYGPCVCDADTGSWQSAELARLERGIVGTWVGTQTNPYSSSSCSVTLTFEANGHYSGHSPGETCAVFYYGTNADSPLKTYRADRDQDERRGVGGDSDLLRLGRRRLDPVGRVAAHRLERGPDAADVRVLVRRECRPERSFPVRAHTTGVAEKNRRHRGEPRVRY